MSKRNRKILMESARNHMDWTPRNLVLWGDETKYNLFGSVVMQYLSGLVGMRQKPTVVKTSWYGDVFGI